MPIATNHSVVAHCLLGGNTTQYRWRNCKPLKMMVSLVQICYEEFTADGLPGGKDCLKQLAKVAEYLYAKATIWRTNTARICNRMRYTKIRFRMFVFPVLNRVYLMTTTSPLLSIVAKWATTLSRLRLYKSWAAVFDFLLNSSNYSNFSIQCCAF